MQNIFYEVNSLDRRCYEEFHLSEDILMEHAANGMATYIKTHYANLNSILIICGSGNNGADGIALARLLHKHFKITLYLHKEPNSKLGKLQLQRVKALGLEPSTALHEADLLVDALFGSGLNREIDQETASLIEKINLLKSIKLACDMPSGLNKEGNLYSHAFVADVTLTMGALKRGLYSDKAKENVGEIQTLDLGLSRELYEQPSNWKLLEKTDLKPPFREKKNTHKGSFGHASFIHGEKVGASIIAALAAASYGAGLVTLVGEKLISLPYSLMQDEHLPLNTNALACGMGLGKNFQRDRLSKLLAHDIPMVLDADIFYHSIFTDLLHKEMIITPHPKEFIYILKLLSLADITVEELQNNRFKYAELFNKRYPHITLILKGSNSIIAFKNQFFINPLGTSVLAKGGSGDILAGLCASLLAQGYSCLDAAIQATLAQTLSAVNVNKNSYALLPEDIIQGLSCL
jgi:hydroxyethylthiazole kinase-like uncharacterized protein yjeF